MPKASLKKEKWTLSFDPRLKRLLIKEAQKSRWLTSSACGFKETMNRFSQLLSEG